jgi:alpha-L-fucosidase 2
LWEHYEFTGDKKFLPKFIPLMNGAALFFLDGLSFPEAITGSSRPVDSPENSLARSAPDRRWT